MSDAATPIIAILGPTGSGKSRLALDLATAFRGEILSCDALQVYRHMNIGTAKSGPEELAQIPHHLLDLREPGEDFSAGDYQRLGREVLEDLRRRHVVPLVVGGTGFYFRALIEGLFIGPGRSEELRARMRRIVARKGSPALHRALMRVDPISAGRIMASDASRIIRAYEVYLLTGKTMAWWQEQPRDEIRGYQCLKLGIRWPREALYHRIDERVDVMFAKGFLQEVQSLMERFEPGSQAFKAIGYREVSSFLSGHSSLQQATEDMKRESRRYAKRQLTWFRRDEAIIWLDAAIGWDTLMKDAFQHVSRFLARADGDTR
jgi:tRNA dimethylallyltransferase